MKHLKSFEYKSVRLDDRMNSLIMSAGYFIESKLPKNNRYFRWDFSENFKDEKYTNSITSIEYSFLYADDLSVVEEIEIKKVFSDLNVKLIFAKPKVDLFERETLMTFTCELTPDEIIEFGEFYEETSKFNL